jgi:ribonuclease P protein component
LAISKKAVPLATRRNRLKRLIRDRFRHIAATLPAVDLVVYVQPGSANLSAPELRQILTQLWAKVVERCASC